MPASHLAKTEYNIARPAGLLGLSFLRFAGARFAAQRAKLEKSATSSRRGSRLDEPATYHAEGILYLPAEARFDYLLNHGRIGSPLPLRPAAHRQRQFPLNSTLLFCAQKWGGRNFRRLGRLRHGQLRLRRPLARTGTPPPAHQKPRRGCDGRRRPELIFLTNEYSQVAPDDFNEQLSDNISC